MSEVTAQPGGWAPATPAEVSIIRPTFSTEHTPETRAAVYHGVYIFALSFVLGGMAIALFALVIGEPFGVWP